GVGRLRGASLLRAAGGARVLGRPRPRAGQGDAGAEPDRALGDVATDCRANPRTCDLSDARGPGREAQAWAGRTGRRRWRLTTACESAASPPTAQPRRYFTTAMGRNTAMMATAHISARTTK